MSIISPPIVQTHYKRICSKSLLISRQLRLRKSNETLEIYDLCNFRKQFSRNFRTICFQAIISWSWKLCIWLHIQSRAALTVHVKWNNVDVFVASAAAENIDGKPFHPSQVDARLTQFLSDVLILSREKNFHASVNERKIDYLSWRKACGATHVFAHTAKTKETYCVWCKWLCWCLISLVNK